MPADSIPQATRLDVARSILRRNLRVHPGERVLIEGWSRTLPWAVALAREARRIGARPLVLYEDDDAYWDTVDAGGAKLLGTMPDHEVAALRETDVFIHMWGPTDSIRLERLPEATRGRLLAFNRGWYGLAAKAGLRGGRLEIGRPYPTTAEAYGVDEATWMRQLIDATLVDPATLTRAAAPIARALARGRTLRIRHENGTDLTLGLARRRPTVWDARVPAGAKPGMARIITIPNGAVRVGLDERVADGTIVANRTSFYNDLGATGATFHFSGGRLTEATFDHGGERFDREFARGGKGRDQPGWIGIGLNPKLHNTPPDEDLERGAVTVSVGGNRPYGGVNASPFFGWAVAAGATVEVDGRRISP